MLLPSDLVTTDSFDNPQVVQTVAAAEIPRDFLAVDIGPRTRKAFAAAVGRTHTLFWNGPLGVFEKPPFDEGTRAVALGPRRLPRLHPDRRRRDRRRRSSGGSPDKDRARLDRRRGVARVPRRKRPAGSRGARPAGQRRRRMTGDPDFAPLRAPAAGGRQLEDEPGALERRALAASSGGAAAPGHRVALFPSFPLLPGGRRNARRGGASGSAARISTRKRKAPAPATSGGCSSPTSAAPGRLCSHGRARARPRRGGRARGREGGWRRYGAGLKPLSASVRPRDQRQRGETFAVSTGSWRRSPALRTPSSPGWCSPTSRSGRSAPAKRPPRKSPQEAHAHLRRPPGGRSGGASRRGPEDSLRRVRNS